MKSIPIRSRNGPVGEAIVDDRDYVLVSRFRWYRHPKGYVIAGIKDYELTGRHGQTSTSMHRLIMGCKAGDGQIVDHINHDPLDNRRENLRLVTPGKSLRNRRVFNNEKAPYKGVRQASSGRWVAYIHLGGFNTAEEAAQAYDDAIRKLFPGFPVNFPQDGEPSAMMPEDECNLVYG